MTRVEVIPLQHALGVKEDGYLGPVSYAALLSKIGRPGPLAEPLAQAMVENFPAYGVTERLRIIHFLARAHVETGGFKWLCELGGAAYLARYDGRLGNTQPGDGARYCGRGIFQVTGRANYRHASEEFGVDFVASPALLQQPDWAVKTACLYWRDHDLNAYADADDGHAIGNAINRGSPHAKGDPNGWVDQQAVIAKLKGLWQ